MVVVVVVDVVVVGGGAVVVVATVVVVVVDWEVDEVVVVGKVIPVVSVAPPDELHAAAMSPNAATTSRYLFMSPPNASGNPQ